MTDAQRLVIKDAVETYTAKHGKSKKKARSALIREGIYTPKGNLRAEFGGLTRKTKSAA